MDKISSWLGKLPETMEEYIMLVKQDLLTVFGRWSR